MCQYYDHIIAYMEFILTTGDNSLSSADDGTDQDIFPDVQTVQRYIGNGRILFDVEFQCFRMTVFQLIQILHITVERFVHGPCVFNDHICSHQAWIGDRIQLDIT